MKRLLLLIFVITTLLTSALMITNTPIIYAQTTPRPTPTTIPTVTPIPTATSAPSADPVESKAPAAPAKVGVVHGYVIDYSNSGAAQGGVPVVLSGNGWQVETVSDSNGYFQFLGLGEGKGVLSLKLPPEAHPINADWMVDTGIETPAYSNVGFYWGETPPVPVLLSAEENADTLDVKIANQSGGDANNLAVSVMLPTGISVKNASSKLGSVEKNDDGVLFLLDTLPTDEVANIVIAIESDGTQTDDTASVTFTYNEQITPQKLILSTGEVAPKEDANVKTTESEAQPAKIDAESEALIPDTGHNRTLPQSTLPILILSIVFIIGLGIAGVKAFKHA